VNPKKQNLLDSKSLPLVKSRLSDEIQMVTGSRTGMNVVRSIKLAARDNLGNDQRFSVGASIVFMDLKVTTLLNSKSSVNGSLLLGQLQ